MRSGEGKENGGWGLVETVVVIWGWEVRICKAWWNGSGDADGVGVGGKEWQWRRSSEG